MPETRWPAALGRRGVVASPHPLATVAGLEVLRRGGTAVDAAVAVGATIAVAYPHMTGLGGDSFWLLWNARAARLTALQAAGGAAARATPELYRRHGLSQIPARGPLAALTVPGAPDGLWTAHTFSRERLGSTVPWGDLLEAAIRHAADGIPVSPCQARVTASATDLIAAQAAPFAPFRATYLDGGGRRRRDGGSSSRRSRARSTGLPARAGARSTRARSRPRSGGRARRSGARCVRRTLLSMARASPSRRWCRTAEGWRPRSPRRARDWWRSPCWGCSRGPTSASAPATRPTTSTSWSRPRSSHSATGTAGSPTRTTSPVPLDRLLDPAYLRDRGRRIAMDRAAPAPLASGRRAG